MSSLHLVNVSVHVVAGCLALAVGLVPLLSAKGGSTHRRSGKLFVLLGAFVLAPAMIACIFFDPPGSLIAVTLAGSYQYVGSIRSLRLADRAPGLLDAFMAIGALLACAALSFAVGRNTAFASPAIAYSTIGSVALIATYDLSRHFWARTWTARIRPLDHGLKMTGAYFAMLSAGLGNLVKSMQPWSQIGPSALGTLVIVIFAVAYFRRGSKARLEITGKSAPDLSSEMG